MSTFCSIAHENEETPCDYPEKHNRPGCRYQLRKISKREFDIAGSDIANELAEHKVELRCTLICARHGPMSHVAIGVIEDITRQYSTKIERDAITKVKAGFAAHGFEA